MSAFNNATSAQNSNSVGTNTNTKASPFQGNDNFVYVDAPHYLKCVICTDVMKLPVSLVCGHSFCAVCCQSALERKKECPCCRKEVTHSPHPNISLCQALDEQLVHCRFGPLRPEMMGGPFFELDSQGCTHILRRAEVPSHEKECPYRWMVCGLADPQTEEKCKVLCRKNELAEHQRQCDFRLVSCPNEGCDDQSCVRSLDRHKEHCLFENVKCPNEGCPEYHLRRSLRSHQDQCPCRVVLCMFHKYGCNEKGNVTAMDEHMKNGCNEHLMLLCSALEFQQHRQQQDKRVTCPKRKFKCYISHFEQLAKKQVIDVDLDVSWKLKIWPNGEDKRHKGYVSIRLFSREASPNFRVEGPYTLRIVNQTDSAKSIVKMTEASCREWADSVRGWGFPAFAKVEEVLDPASGFVKDNKLIIEVEVVVQSVVEIVEYSEDVSISSDGAC